MNIIVLGLLILCCVSEEVSISPGCASSKTLYGDICLDNCPSTYIKKNVTYTYQGEVQSYFRCFKQPNTVQEAKFPSGCKPEFISMYFSWVSYDTKTGKTGDVFSPGSVYKRIPKACGTWTVSNVIENDDYDRREFVLVVENRQAGIVLFVFRGTETSFQDWVSNVQFCLTTCPFTPNCGEVHEGFLFTYYNIRVDLQEQLRYYTNAGYDIIFTGHSQGASTTQIAAFDTVITYPQLKKRLSVYSFGTPRTGDEFFAAAYNNTMDRSFRYVSQFSDGTEDAVTTVPPEVFGFYHTKNKRVVDCQRERFGNFETIPGVEVYYYPKSFPKFLVPTNLGCHFQEVYTDGILYG